MDMAAPSGLLATGARGVLILAPLAASVLLSGEAAWAQSPQPSNDTIALEEIEVTARRSAEKLADVPVSVSAVDQGGFSVEAPSNAAIDISRRVPNYSVTDVGNPLFAFGAIRGVGTLGFPQNPFDSTIGYALNGQPLSMYAGSQQLLDVTRVEVLRGPQNVLFGRASQGGTVNLVTAEPDGERDLRVRGEIGTNKEYFTDMIAGGTLIPGVLNGRATLRFTGGEGDVKNLNGGEKLPDRDIGAARGSLRWFLGDSTTVTTSGFYERDDRHTFNYILRGGPNYPAVDLDEPLGFDRKLALGHVEIKHELDAFDLTGTFGAQNVRSHMSSDNTDGLIYGALGMPPSSVSNDLCTDCTRYLFKERAYSGELRASSKPDAPLRWIAGVSVYDSTFEQGGTNTNSFGPTQNGRYAAKLDLRSYSAFGEIGVPLGGGWTLTPGLRVGHDAVSRKGSYVSNGAAGTVPSFDERDEVSGGFAAGGVTLDYKPNESSLIYGSIKRGYSNAGFPYFNIFSVFGQRAPSYPASHNWTYEAGARTSLFEGRLTLDGSVFFNDVKKGHVNQFDLRANNFTIAALDYETYGFEIAARAKLTDVWSVYGSLGYVHAAFVNVPSLDETGARGGGRLPGVPEWSGMIGIENRLGLQPYGLAGALVSSAELQFTAGRRPADLANTFDLHNYQIVNARIG